MKKQPKKNELWYHNDMNCVSFKDFTAIDYDVFISVAKQVSNMGTKEVVIPYEDIMDIMEWSSTDGIIDFHNHVYRVAQKLSDVKYKYKDDATFRIFNLFESFEGNAEKMTLTVKVTGRFSYILSDLSRDFTILDIKEYIRLRSRYTKVIYMNVRQRYRLRGHFWQTSVEELRSFMDLPETMRPKYILDDVIKPSLEAIRKCKGLSDLNVEVIKARRRGSPVIGYRFTWTPCDQIKGQSDMEQGLEEMRKYNEQKRTGKSFVSIEQSPSYKGKTNEDLERELTDNL